MSEYVYPGGQDAGTNVYLWIDDERPTPSGFTHSAKTSAEAIEILSSLSEDDVLVTVAFDHDLGYNFEDGHPSLDGGVQDDTTRPVVRWMIENGVWPEVAIIHSQNRVGAEWIHGTLASEGPEGMIVARMPYKPSDWQ